MFGGGWCSAVVVWAIALVWGVEWVGGHVMWGTRWKEMEWRRRVTGEARRGRELVKGGERGEERNYGGKSK